MPPSDSYWRNLKTGDVYLVIGLARHSESGEEFVVYFRDGMMWVRPRELFLAKFKPMSDEKETS